MKQGRPYLKIIMLVLALMVVSYLLYSIVSSSSRGRTTIRAAIFTTSEAEEVSGFLVRREQRIPGVGGSVYPLRSEGEKIANGAAVALSLQNAVLAEKLSEKDRLEQEQAQLQLALEEGTQYADRQSAEKRTGDAVRAFLTAQAKGELSAAEEAGAQLKALILRQSAGQSDPVALRRQLSEITERLTALQSEIAEGTRSISAPASGYYSAAADGLESILTPEALETMTPGELTALLSRSDESGAQSAGRLITSDTWYFAAAADTKALEGLHPGSTVDVSFQGAFHRELEMNIVSMNQDQEGQTLLVLSSPNFLSEVSALRRQSAQIVFRSYSGLRVPKEAIRFSEEENSAGVYVLEGAKVRWKNVTLLYDGGDYYVVELDKSSTLNLWPEDEIVLDTNGLTDGALAD